MGETNTLLESIKRLTRERDEWKARAEIAEKANATFANQHDGPRVLIGPAQSYICSAPEMSPRAQLADQCGALRTERDELLQENAILRRKLEKLERKK